MKKTMVLLSLVFSAAASFAEPPIAANVTQIIPGAKAKYGLDNFKMVMPGVLYRGGNGVGGQNPMGAAQAQALCKDGFDAAVYGYSKNWSGGAKTINCQTPSGVGGLTYVMKRWDNSKEVTEAMRELKNIIDQGHGAMYVHCWYGVHASGLLAAAALKQFCGYSDQKALAYWNSNVAAKIQYPAAQQKVLGWKPDPSLNITPEQQARVCPK